MSVRPTRSKEHAPNLVAIVVPLANRAELTPDERISLNHLTHFLGHYDKYLAVREGLNIAIPGFAIKRFKKKFFGSGLAHNRLMLSQQFYEAFRDYRYILNYHLDALVFSDQLIQWCSADFDYIGPPWVVSSGNSQPIGFSMCGNGGFSLRKTESFLKVIEPAVHCVTGDQAWHMACGWRPRNQRVLLRPLKYVLRLQGLNRSRWVRSFYTLTFYSRHHRNEDKFWSTCARQFYPAFLVAPVDAGLRFGFDNAPRYCFEQNRKTLPFGCHGWNNYDRAFWEPYLIK